MRRNDDVGIRVVRHDHKPRSLVVGPPSATSVGVASRVSVYTRQRQQHRCLTRGALLKWLAASSDGNRRERDAKAIYRRDRARSPRHATRSVAATRVWSIGYKRVWSVQVGVAKVNLVM
jgi:hypothetical protein